MKKIFIFLLVLIVVFMPVISFASGSQINIMENYPTSDDHNFPYAIVYEIDGVYQIVKSDAPITRKDNGYWIDYGKVYRRWRYDFDTNNWSIVNTATYGDGYLFAVDIYPLAAYPSIYDYYDGTLFFSNPSPPSSLVQTMKTVESWMILKIILAGLIPLLGLVISAICFRKAWAFLHSQLQH